MPRGTLNAGLTGPTATYSFGKITTIKTTQPAFKVQPGTANANILVVAGGGMAGAARWGSWRVFTTS